MAETIASRCTRLNQLLSGKSPGRRIPILDKDALLDALMVLYRESNVDYMMRDKNIATFVNKFKQVISEIQSLRIKKSDFEIRKTIGRGHFGEVHVVREKITGNVYAMKVLKKSETLSQDNVAFFEEERDIMAFSGNPWITQLAYSFQDPENLYLVMDYHPGGDLLALLSKYDDVLEEDMARFYMAEMVMAIHAVHALGYVHRDIKPENVLIDRTGHIKLADFGSSAKLSSAKMVVSKMPVGTPEYIAPEVLTSMDGSGGKYGVECDWWSLGVVTYEMLVGNTPFEGDSVVEVYSQIMDFKNSLQFPDDLTISDDGKGLIRGLLQDRKERMGYEILANHSFFKGIDWTTLKDAVPPYVPTLSSNDDTSHFEEFEPEHAGPKIEDFMKSKEGFSGKDLPFIGFTYTKHLQAESRQETNTPTSPVRSGSTSGFNSRSSVKSQELKDAQQHSVQLRVENEQLQKKVEELQRTAESKEKHANRMADERDLLEKEKVLLQTEILNLQKNIAEEQTERQRSETEVLRLVQEMQESSKKAKEARDDEVSSMMFESKQLISQLEQERFMANKRTQHLEKELDESQKVLEENKSRIADLQGKLTKVNEDTKYSVSELQLKLQKVTSDNEARVKEFQEKLSKATSAAHEASSQLKEVEKERDDLRRELEEAKAYESVINQEEVEKQRALDDSESQLKEELQKKNDRCLQLEKEASNLKSRLEEAEMRYDKLIEAGEEMKRELTTKIEALEESLSATKKEQRRLEIDHKKLEDDFQERTNSLKAKDETIHALEESCRKLEQQVTNILSKNTDVAKEKKNEQILDLEKQVADLAKVKRSLENELSVAHGELKTLQQSNASLKKRLQEAQKEQQDSSERYESKVSKLQKDLSKAHEEAAKANKELLTTRKSASILHDKISKLEVEVETQRHAVKEAARSKAAQEIEGKLRQTIKNYNDAKAEKKMLEAKLRQANSDLTDLKRRNEELEEEVKERERQAKSQDLTVSMLKQTCTMLEGQVEELEVMNDEYQDREEQWNLTKRQLYQTQEKLEQQLTEALQALEMEKSSRIKSEEKLKIVDSDIVDVKSESARRIEKLESTIAQHTEKIKELTNQLTETERSRALAEVNAKNHERRLTTETEERAKLQEEVTRMQALVSSQKTSNFALTQDLEAAEEKMNEIQFEKDSLQNQLERTAYANAEEKIKLEGTLAQQTKLIDFLQAKVEDKGKKKFYQIRGGGSSSSSSKPKGGQDNTLSIPRRYKDLEQALEKEKNANIQLHVQLTKAREELATIKAELAQFKSASKSNHVNISTQGFLIKNPEIMNLLQQNPGYQNRPPSERGSPSSSVADLYNMVAASVTGESRGNQSPALKDKSLSVAMHKVQPTMNMRSSKCPVCLSIVHFGKQVQRCQECGIVCHIQCAHALPNTCGLPSSALIPFSLHLREHGDRRSLIMKEPGAAVLPGDTVDGEMTISKIEGWLRIPRKGSVLKQGWDRKWVVLDNNALNIYDNENTIEYPPIDTVRLDAIDGDVSVNSAVPASELVGCASTDVPHSISVKLISHSKRWPGRTIYLLAPTFADKQKWVAALEFLSKEVKRKNNRAVEKVPPENVMFQLEGKDKIDPYCTAVVNGKIMLIGAEEGLFGLEVDHAGIRLPVEIPGFDHVYQLSVMEELDCVFLLYGKEKAIYKVDMRHFQLRQKQPGSSPKSQGRQVEKIKSCHMFIVGKVDGDIYLCAATGDKLAILKYTSGPGSFVLRKEIDTGEPCSCLQFGSNSVIYGAGKFYSVDFRNFVVKELLDSSDVSLAFAVFGSAQVHTFPVAVFRIKGNTAKEEFLLCYNEFGVFVGGEGRRSRLSDLKWTSLPLAFVYREPHLFVTCFQSIEVWEIPPDSEARLSTYKKDDLEIPNPRVLGPWTAPGSIVVSSFQNEKLRVVTLRGGIANGERPPSTYERADERPMLSSTEQMLRSTSNHSICSDEETSRRIAQRSGSSSPSVKGRSEKGSDKKDHRMSSFRIPFSFKGSKRSSQYGEDK